MHRAEMREPVILNGLERRARSQRLEAETRDRRLAACGQIERANCAAS
jgi:hypothetical protein